MRMDIAYLIRRSARNFHAAPAIDDGILRLSHGALVDRSERFANALDAHGTPPGACVGILSENRSEYVVTDVAVALARRVRVALNARLHLDDFRFVAQDSGMRTLVHSAQFEEQATALRDKLGIQTISLDPGGASPWYDDLIADASGEPVHRPGSVEEPAWITYTSGTTGRPKGVVLSHRSIREVGYNLLLELGQARPGDRLVLTQPLSHGAGYFVLPYLACGAELYVLRRFDPEEVRSAAAGPGRRLLKLVPAMLPGLLELPERDWAYESIVYGAAAITPQLLDAALERFGPTLVQIYGQSEAPVTLTCLRAEDHVDAGPQRFSAGRPWQSVAVEVRDPEGNEVPDGETGEVVVRGSHLMTGYHGLPEETAAVFRDGWIHTRDVGRVDDRGFVYLLGRSDEMINSGGFNISPREVELVLAEHPGVQEAVVVGVPDPRWGSAVSAIVRVRDGSALTGPEIIEFARPRLGYRCPRAVTLASEIPRTPYGKIDRTELLRSLDGAGQ